MGLWPASGFGSRRGKMEPSTDQFLVDKFLKIRIFIQILNINCTYSLKGYNRLSLFQGVPWKSVIKPVSAVVLFLNYAGISLARNFFSSKRHDFLLANRSCSSPRNFEIMKLSFF